MATLWRKTKNLSTAGQVSKFDHCEGNEKRYLMLKLLVNRKHSGSFFSGK